MHKYGANRLLVVGAQTQSNARPNLLPSISAQASMSYWSHKTGLENDMIKYFTASKKKADFCQELGER